jgi:hypothetical protein
MDRDMSLYLPNNKRLKIPDSLRFFRVQDLINFLANLLEIPTTWISYVANGKFVVPFVETSVLSNLEARFCVEGKSPTAMGKSEEQRICQQGLRPVLTLSPTIACQVKRKPLKFIVDTGAPMSIVF